MRTLFSLLALFAVMACGRRAHDSPDAFRWEAELEPGTTIHLRTGTGRIDVTPGSSRFARVTGATHWVGRNDPIRFAWKRDGDELYVCALRSSRSDCDEDSGSFGDSGHSWLDIFSLFKRRSTNAMASFRVEIPSQVKVDARTMSGTISLSGVTGGISAETVNGSIDIHHAAGAVEAKSTNGNIDAVIDSLAADDEVTLKGVNGSMTAVLPPDFEAEVDLSTVNGGIRSDFAVTTEGELSKRHLHGQIGSSSREITLKTVNGNVSLLRAAGETGDDPPGPPKPPRPIAPRPRR
jgi:putative adhesin